MPRCSSNSVRSDVSSHSFPEVKSSLGRQWLHAVRRKLGRDFCVNKHTKVCSKHFLAKDFQVKSSSAARRSLGTLKRRLVPGAVPSVFSFAPVTSRCRERRPPTQRNLFADCQETQVHGFSLIAIVEIIRVQNFTSSPTQPCFQSAQHHDMPTIAEVRCSSKMTVRGQLRRHLERQLPSKPRPTKTNKKPCRKFDTVRARLVLQQKRKSMDERQNSQNNVRNVHEEGRWQVTAPNSLYPRKVKKIGALSFANAMTQ